MHRWEINAKTLYIWAREAWWTVFIECYQHTEAGHAVACEIGYPTDKIVSMHGNCLSAFFSSFAEAKWHSGKKLWERDHISRVIRSKVVHAAESMASSFNWKLKLFSNLLLGHTDNDAMILVVHINTLTVHIHKQTLLSLNTVSCGRHINNNNNDSNIDSDARTTTENFQPHWLKRIISPSEVCYIGIRGT